jgi:hypothetical protein
MDPNIGLRFFNFISKHLWWKLFLLLGWDPQPKINSSLNQVSSLFSTQKYWISGADVLSHRYIDIKPMMDLIFGAEVLKVSCRVYTS